MTFDPKGVYTRHMTEDGGVQYEQGGAFYTPQGEPIVTTKPTKTEVADATVEIPEGFKKGRFGRLVPA